MQAPTTSDLETRYAEAGREAGPSLAPQPPSAPAPVAGKAVTMRAILLGLLLSAGVAALNCWIETVANVHFVGGVQMPFGVIFALVFLVLGVNLPLRALGRRLPVVGRILPPLSAVELTTIYAMMLFGALISTPGAENIFITIGPALFYYGTRQNHWADTFYGYLPQHFAPGWDGQTFRRDVIEPMYMGGLSPAAVPWHAWTVMLVAWSVFLLLVYALLFFTSLFLRRQWIENEALSFPLVQLPLQMVEVDAHDINPPARAFWNSRTMWAGFALAASFHFLRGLNNYYPDWPIIPSFQGNFTSIDLTEKPWNAIGSFPLKIYLGGIGIAYLLTRELSLSVWAFFVFIRLELVIADLLGYPAALLPRGPYVPMGGISQPTFIEFQGVGGWAMMGVLLLWPVRTYVAQAAREAWASNRALPGEPFSPRFVLGGWLFCMAALMAWCSYSGINVVLALVFFGIYLLTSIVLARLVVEGGLLFPQSTFMPLEWMTIGMMGTNAIGPANLTRLSFLQTTIMMDMRTNTLPAFLHTFKLAHEQGLSPSAVRRLMGAVAAALVVSLGVTLFTTIASLYGHGGLASYSVLSIVGPQRVWAGAATMISTQPAFDPMNGLWMVVGAVVVWLMVFARSRFAWFPLHPLGYIGAAGYGVSQLWLSFFIGWFVKTTIMKYGGNSAVVQTRPFMIGLILGNATAMVFWLIAGFVLGSQIPYWPA